MKRVKGKFIGTDAAGILDHETLYDLRVAQDGIIITVNVIGGKKYWYQDLFSFLHNWALDL